MDLILLNCKDDVVMLHKVTPTVVQNILDLANKLLKNLPETPFYPPVLATMTYKNHLAIGKKKMLYLFVNSYFWIVVSTSVQYTLRQIYINKRKNWIPSSTGVKSQLPIITVSHATGMYKVWSLCFNCQSMFPKLLQNFPSSLH